MNLLAEVLEECHDDPETFVEGVLECRLRLWQRRFYGQIRDQLGAGNRHIQAIARTCHGAGKTMATAGLALWWMTTRAESRALTTAPSWAGVENLLWPEIARLYNGSRVLRRSSFGRLLTTRFEVSPGWYMVGAASDKPENLEGHHSPTAAARLIDEAKAVDQSVFDATLGMLDAPETLDIWISTPSIESGAFWERDIRGGPGIIRAVVTIDDLVEEGIPGKSAWRENARKAWGETSDTYRARAMAEYIQNSEGALFPAGWVEAAMQQSFEVRADPVLGFDVAGSSDGDESVVALATGPDYGQRYSVRILDAWRERDTMLSKGRALAAARREKARDVRVDTIGLGKGVHDAMRMEFPRTSAYRATDQPTDRSRFINRKAEDAWFLRELLEAGRIRIGPDSLLKSQLVAMKYQIDRAGRTRIVDPADSPDRVDALLIALAACRPSPLEITEDDFAFGETDIRDEHMGIL